ETTQHLLESEIGLERRAGPVRQEIEQVHGTVARVGEELPARVGEAQAREEPRQKRVEQDEARVADRDTRFLAGVGLAPYRRRRLALESRRGWRQRRDGCGDRRLRSRLVPWGWRCARRRFSKRLEPAQHARVCTGRDRIEGVGERRLRDEPPVARGARRNEPPHEGERGRLGGVYPKRVPNQPDEPRDALRMLRALERRTHAREHGRLEQRREAERGGVPFEPLERGGRGEQRSGKLRREPL